MYFVALSRVYDSRTPLVFSIPGAGGARRAVLTSSLVRRGLLAGGAGGAVDAARGVLVGLAGLAPQRGALVPASTS